MNTSGMIRGYMAKNMSPEEFIGVVAKAFRGEFEEEVGLKPIGKDGFAITMKDYKVAMTIEEIKELQSPYRLDQFILKAFEGQGFVLDRNRSQYIQYCFGNFSRPVK